MLIPLFCTWVKTMKSNFSSYIQVNQIVGIQGFNWMHKGLQSKHRKDLHLPHPTKFMHVVVDMKENYTCNGLNATALLTLWTQIPGRAISLQIWVEISLDSEFMKIEKRRRLHIQPPSLPGWKLQAFNWQQGYFSPIILAQNFRKYILCRLKILILWPDNLDRQ